MFLKAKRKDLNKQLATYKDKREDPPLSLQNEIASTNQTIASEEFVLSEFRVEASRINARFDAERHRLLPLWYSRPTMRRVANR
jgi:hypothetical protein